MGFRRGMRRPRFGGPPNLKSIVAESSRNRYYREYLATEDDRVLRVSWKRHRRLLAMVEYRMGIDNYIETDLTIEVDTTRAESIEMDHMGVFC